MAENESAESSGGTEPKKLLEQNIVWFAIGLVVAGAIGAVAFLAFLDKRIDAQIEATLPSNLDQRLTEAADKASSAESAVTAASAAISELRSASNLQATKFGKQFTALNTKDNQLANQIAKIASTEPDLTPMQAAIREHGHNDLSNRVLLLEEALLHGAVVAFDRSERGLLDQNGTAAGGGGACPPGWSLFREAGGRSIIGAGQHENQDRNGNDLETYPSYADNPGKAVGGEERHILTEAEMADHKHEVLDATGRILTLDDRSNEEGTYRLSFNGKELDGNAKAPVIAKPIAEKSAPHNNMPPYIALYFCKYMGTG